MYFKLPTAEVPHYTYQIALILGITAYSQIYPLKFCWGNQYFPYNSASKRLRHWSYQGKASVVSSVIHYTHSSRISISYITYLKPVFSEN